MENEIQVRRMLEEREAQYLAPYAALSMRSLGRAVPEEESATRTCFQRDTDRIAYSKAFRRLKHKTQVFLQPEGDHYRTRMTHTIEVSRIARTLGRALCLNEDLIEAAALGHDLGHTPFGHAGERALNSLVPGGFRHNEQSLRVVDKLEKNGAGLNLCQEVRSGILTHNVGGGTPTTLEAMLVRIADKTAYINHDTDDSIRAGIISPESVPACVREVLGETHSQRINTVVESIVRCSAGKPEILIDDYVAAATKELRSFLFDAIYTNPVAKSEESKTINILGSLYEQYLKHLELLPEDYRRIIDEDGAERAVCDYIAGMTDQYATSCFSDLFIPYAWTVR